MAREHLEERRAEREHVRPRIDDAAARLLRRHVAGGAEDVPFAREPARGGIDRLAFELREPEIEDLHAPVFPDEHVLRLQIAMEEPLAVRVREALEHLAGVGDRLADRELAVVEHAAQAVARDVLEDDEHAPVFFAGLVHGDEIRVGHRRRRARFAEEACASIRVRRDRSR